MNAAIILLVIIITLIIIYLSRVQPHIENNTDDVFSTNSISDMIQIQELYSIKEFENYRTYNPGVFILNNNSNPWFIYRVSNFTLCGLSGCKIWDNGNKNKINSYIFLLAPNGEIIKVTHPEFAMENCVRGCEDARTIVYKDKLMLVCNSSSGENCLRKMMIMELDLQELNEIKLQYVPIFGEKRTMVREIMPSRYSELKIRFDQDKNQKNWMPFIFNDDLYFVYSVQPHIILKYHEDGTCNKIYETSNDSVPKNLRGGTSIVKTSSHYYLGLLHVREADHRYVTYMYAFDSSPPFGIAKISKPFVFGEGDIRTKRIQFASGLEMVNEHGVNYLYITYGEDDCRAKLCKIKETDAMNALGFCTI